MGRRRFFSVLFVIWWAPICPISNLRDVQPRDAAYLPSRPFLEDHVRQRFRAIRNVTLMDGYDVVELTSSADRSRITGVRLLEFIEDCTPLQVLSALRSAEPLGDVARYRTPSSRWRRYDKMRRFPAGLLVFGDAICSFNPIYGQGMTVAALQALVLNRCLRADAQRLAARYFAAAAKPIGVAWQLAAAGDLNLPEVQGPRPLSMRLINKYVDRVQAAAETDTVIAERFAKVAGLSNPPSSLMAPSVMLRVAATNWRQRRHSGPSITRVLHALATIWHVYSRPTVCMPLT